MGKKAKGTQSAEQVSCKKKGSCGKKCACCFTTVLLLVVLLFGGLFAAAAILYGQYLQPQTQVEFFPALDVIFSLYGGNEKKLVTNPYSAGDLDSFYADLKHAMFISEDTEIDVGTLLKGAMEPGVENGGESGGGTAESGTTGNGGFDAFLNSLNFDFSSLKNYDGKSEWVLEVSDKQAGAVAGEVMKTMLQDPQAAAFSEAVSVKQIIVNNADAADPELVLTAGFSVETLIKKTLAQAGAGGWGDFAAFFLPKNIFFTLYVYPLSDKPMRYVLNDYSDEKMANLNSLVNGILSMTGGGGQNGSEVAQPQSLNDIFAEFDAQFKKLFAELNSKLEITFVDSALKMKPVKTLLSILGIDQNVSERELLTMMRHIVSADMSALDAEYDLKWSEADAQTFIANLEEAYAIDAGAITTDNFFTSIQSVADHVKISNLDLTVPAEQMKVGLTYKALCALVQKHVESDMNQTQEFEITITSISSFEKDAKRYLRITVKADLKTYIRGKMGAEVPEAAKKMLDALLPPYVYLSVETAADGGAGENLNFNGVGTQNTLELLSTLGKVAAAVGDPQAAEQISGDKLLATVGDALHNALAQMEGQGGVKVEFGASAVTFPSVYDSLLNFYNMSGVESDELRLALLGLSDVDSFESQALINPSALTAPAFDALPVTLTDKGLGYLLNNGIDTVEGNLGYQPGDLSVVQALLCDLSNPNAAALTQNPVFASHLAQRSGKYMLLTLKINLESVTGSQIGNIVPAFAYATAAIGLDQSAPSFLFLNGLSEARTQIIRDLIFKITGEDKLNLESLLQNVDSYAKDKEIIPSLTVGEMLTAGEWKMREGVDMGGEGLGYIEYTPVVTP